MSKDNGKVKGVALSKIAASLKMDAKNARARLRRIKVPANMLAADDQWIFTPKGAEWVKKELKKDHRKAA